MGKYRLKYASVGGSLTGKVPGDEVTVTGEEEQQLLTLGLIESEEDYQQRQDAKAEAEAEAQEGTTHANVSVEWASLSAVVSPERMAELMTEEEDRLLEPFRGKGGWYAFGEGDDAVKVQGRDAAVEELARRMAEDAETVQKDEAPKGDNTDARSGQSAAGE